MSRRGVVRAAGALVLLAVLGSCSTEDRRAAPTAAPSTSTAPATEVTTTVPSTTVRTTAPPTTQGIPGGCPTGVGVAAQGAQQAARCLVKAWEADDRTRAAAFASLDVVELLFRLRWTPPAATFRGCAANAGTGGQTCTFEHHSGRYVLDARMSEGGWRVTQLQHQGS